MTKPPDPLDLLYARTRTLADRVEAGELAFLDAVDMAWTPRSSPEQSIASGPTLFNMF